MNSGIDSKRLITDGKKFRKIVDIQSEEIKLPDGIIAGSKLKKITPGSRFSLGERMYYIFECTLHDFVHKKLKRHTQIIYPKETAYLIYKLDISPGDRIGEAGTGSGAMTLSLSRAVGPEGRVYTYEKREDFCKKIENNLAEGKKFDNIVFHNRSLENGILENCLEAFVLDIKTPWEVLDIIAGALKPAGILGILVPTFNQISETLRRMEETGFYCEEILELMLRRYKRNPDRLRPEDTMVGHTGFLLIARKLTAAEIRQL